MAPAPSLAVQFASLACLSWLQRGAATAVWGWHSGAWPPSAAQLPTLCLPQDESVTQLGQELAQKLGLRVRKAYKRPQVGVCCALRRDAGQRASEWPQTGWDGGQVGDSR